MRRLLLLPFLVLSTALVATAQIGGPIKTKPGSNDKAGNPAAKGFSQRFEHEGIAVDFSVAAAPGERGKSNGPVAGSNAVASFRVTDARTGQPLTGLHPNAWISSRVGERIPNDIECKDKIASFMGGLLSVRPDIDLNSYLVWTINHDNTISVINPQIAFSRTKLEGLIVLPGAGADWTLSKSNEFLYVTLPDLSAVAVVDTVRRKIARTISLKPGTKPRRIVLDSSGRHALIGLDNSPYVAVIDTRTNNLAAMIATGEGLHQIEFEPGGRFAYVTNSKANTISIIDTKGLAKVADLTVAGTPVPIAYSSASRSFYVASLNGTEVSVIDPAKRRVVTTIPSEQGVVALRFTPDGRFGFLVNQVMSTVSILDAATNKIVGTTKVVKEPDQVVFTRGYAYIHSIGSEKFSLIELTDFTKTTPAPVDIQGGQKAPYTMPEEIGVADMIAPTPEGNAVMIANNPDRLIYYYVEGMMAPMGTFSNYKRRPTALLLLNRSLSETAPGVYSTNIKLSHSGRFDVPVLLDQPRIHKCFQLEVAPSPDGENSTAGASIAVEPMFKTDRVKTGETVSLKFKIVDSITKKPLKGLNDVTVMVFQQPGIWQQRQVAKEIDTGVYEVTQVFPSSGLFNVMVGAASRGVAFADVPFKTVKVFDE
jgi:YVTN family beta-propeller protein